MIKDIEQGIADYIAEDQYLHDHGHVTVVVEEKADTAFEIQQSLAQLGVCVLVEVPSFNRNDRMPNIQGTLSIEIVCYEHPALNRDDEATLTAQATMERIARILHYKKFPFLIGPVIFKGFNRDDVEDANVVRGNFEVYTRLGHEEMFMDNNKENDNEETK